jgi:atypical dual specificity phosphatase
MVAHGEKTTPRFPVGPFFLTSTIGVLGPRLLLAAFGAFAFTFLLFQKKLLPLGVSKAVSKVFFFPTFPLTVLSRFGNYWTPVDKTLYLGCAPMSILGIPKAISEIGVKGVVNMCYEYSGPKNAYEKLGITQLYLPTCDHFEVSVEDMQEAVAFIKHHKEKGEKVYVHCKAGHGRAASIALCWLIHENPTISPKDLNAALRSQRRVRSTLYEQKNMKAYIKSLK